MYISGFFARHPCVRADGRVECLLSGRVTPVYSIARVDYCTDTYSVFMLFPAHALPARV